MSENWNIPIVQYSRNCPLCGARCEYAIETPYSRPPWRVVCCGICDFVYQDTTPAEELLREELSWEKTHKAETVRRQAERPLKKAAAAKVRSLGRRVFGRHTVNTILRKFATPGAVIDLGCGGGSIHGIGGGFTPYGIEISTTLAAAANTLFKSNGGYVVCDSALNGLKTFPKEFFAAASLRSYLEHESHPHKILDELHRTLKPNAKVIIKVPNFACLNRKIFGPRWCGFRCPEHLNYFTPKSLLKMAKAHEFEIQKTWATPFSDNFWMLLHKKSQSQRKTQ